MKLPSENIKIDTTGFLWLSYPSEACRPVPSFNLIIPPHWVVSEFPNALFVMGSSNGQDGSPVDEFWSNVIVHHERVLPSVSLEEAGRSSWESLKADTPNAIMKEEFIIEFDDLRHFIREVQIPGPTPKETVTRIDSFMFGPIRDHPTLDLFRITWLHPSAAGDERKALFRQILKSVTFD
ncbi:MAG: hypothetical protein EXR70_13395 [Deltaproteobacteria bacterium]|nr:hypothetical protein [Deltaproteobacteria bacterium]